ncbi:MULTISPECIES: FIST signal transduction protein [Thioalkalivibrio]|uniref:Histidine kinase n=1 Tax=Thioalkalivibrio halophilus TaxID=252474 RepID=A0A1V3A2D9_9GAMM|nr:MULTISPECIES: FIST C-terminal domain-containing protein [Thioalkalivibrio]OOC11243.1 histidine kinase [Thioalkalivibrio halophilus]PYG00727.1 small ligand-binding sensory domain FIST [Thioalkalivibrio sp. ALE21]
MSATEPFLCASATGDEPRTLAAELAGQLGELSPAPDGRVRVGFICISDEIARNARLLLRELRKKAPIDHFVGGMGIAVMGREHEYYDDPAVTLMVGELPADSVRLIRHPVRSFDELTRALEGFVDPATPARLILNADPRLEDVEGILTRIGEETAWFATGGINSGADDAVQIADGVMSSGITGLVLRDDVPLVARHTQGCTPLPGQHELTETWRNIIVRLNGEPALPAFRRIIGDVLSRDLKRALGYIQIGFPIPGSDTGDYRVRNITGVDMDQELLAVGETLEQGSRVLFVRRDGQSAHEDLERMLQQIREQCPEGIRGAIYVSCLGRGRHQFVHADVELGTVQRALGGVPLVGFFANGEIFSNRLYAYTGVLTLFT